MTTSPLYNRIRAGGFLQSEADFGRSRDHVTIEGGTGGAGILWPGTVLGAIAATGKYVASPNSGSDGSQNARAVLWDYVDATAGDVGTAVIARSAEVRADDLSFDASVSTLTDMQNKWAQLLANSEIVVRE